MATFNDWQSSQSGPSWIHDLAKAEIHPDAERLLQLGQSFDPQQLVEESMIAFMAGLRDFFHEHARAFNAFSESGQKFQEVKIYSTAQTAADFMLFRNQVKLIVSNPAHGVIRLSFAQHNRGALFVDGAAPAGASTPMTADGAQTQDLIARIGPFRDVYWTFQDEKVGPEPVAKFYFSEFVRVTRDVRRTRSGNQQLLEQIRSLLHEKGLEV